MIKNNIFNILFLLLLSCAPKVSEKDGDHMSQLANQKGLQYFQAGELHSALSEFEKAAALNPRNPEYHNNLAVTLMKLQRLIEAAAAADKAIALSPKHHLYWQNKGLILNQMGRYSQAAEAFNESLKTDPDNFISLQNSGFSYFSMDDKKNALLRWEKADRLNGNPEIKSNLGFLYMENGDFLKARGMFLKALELQPDFYMAAYNLGVLYQNYLHDSNKAIDFYKKASDLRPYEFAPAMNLGILYKKKGLNKEAVSEFKRFLNIVPPQYQQQIQDAENHIKEIEAGYGIRI